MREFHHPVDPDYLICMDSFTNARLRHIVSSHFGFRPLEAGLRTRVNWRPTAFARLGKLGTEV